MAYANVPLGCVYNIQLVNTFLRAFVILIVKEKQKSSNISFHCHAFS